MSRELQIHKAAEAYMNSDAVPTMNMHMAYGDFTRGARWADQHPNWQDATKTVPPCIEGKTYSKTVIILIKWYDRDDHITTMHFGCYDYRTDEWHSSDGTVRKVSFWLDVKAPGEQ